MNNSNPNIKKWTVILNPHAGGGKGQKDWQKIKKILAEKGFDFDLLVSEYPKHTIALTETAILNGTRKLIVAGGDGTLNEVVNGVFLQQVCPPEKITIGMIPVGTGNDWIKTFGIPNKYPEAIKKIQEEKTIFQDVGKVNYSVDRNNKLCFFSNMAGFGFDALVADKANRLKEKNRSGLWVYLSSFVSAYIHYQTRRVKVSVDGNNLEELIFSVSVGIGKYNGGGMMQAPAAVPNDGTFEITIIKKIGVWGILKNITGLYNGSFVKDSRVVCLKGKEVEVSCSNPLAGEADGESLGRSQFRIEIMPKKLRVIVGKLS